MGRNNRQRRADKHRRRERQRDGGSRRPQNPLDFLDPRDVADFVLFEAAEAAEHGEPEHLESLLQQVGTFGRIAGTAMTGALIAALRAAWEGGWQPADVARAAAKRLGTTEAALAAEMIRLDASTGGTDRTTMPDAWAAQLQDLDGEVRGDPERWADSDSLRRGARLLGLLTHLPTLPHLLPPPSQWGRYSRRPERAVPGVDERMLQKVRALLAKAESTAFAEEAEALTAKAQQMMARYSIDHAMIATAEVGEEPSGRRIGVDDPYAQGKAALLASIAGANRCQAVWCDGYGFSTVVGFGNDIDIVEVLYVSLLVQATRAMTAAGPIRDRYGRSRTRAFRQSFMFSYAQRIGERLDEASQAATEEASAVHGSQLLPVLAGRASAVDDAFESMFPNLRSTSSRVTSVAGWAAGRAAADLAQLRTAQQVLPGIAV